MFERKEPTSQDLIGLTREQLEAKLQEGADAKAKLTEIETQLSSGFDELRASLAALKAPPAPVTTPQTQEPTAFWVDPDKAYIERATPLANLSLTTAAKVELIDARNRYSREFALWGKELQDIIDNEPNIATKTNPQFYKNIVDMVTGRHAKDIDEAARKGQSLFTESAGGGLPGGSSDDPKAAARARLSPEQKAAAARFKMTEDEFVASLDYVNLQYGHGKDKPSVQ